MNWLTRLRDALAGSGVDDDVIEELSQDAAARYAALRAGGASPEDAQQAIAEQIEEWRRDASRLRRGQPVTTLIETSGAGGTRGVLADLGHAARRIRRQAGTSLLVVATMAVGIGATTLLFSLVDGVLLEPLPWPQPDRLVRLAETREGATRSWPWIVTNASYLAWRDQCSTISGLAGWTGDTVTLTGAGTARRLDIADVTASLFGVLQAHPALGRVLAPGDERTGGVVVLSDGLWRERFDSDPGVLGRVLRLDGAAYRVVGVMPAGFAFPDPETRAWVPLDVPPVLGEDGQSQGLISFRALARLRPGASPEQAAEEATARARTAPDAGLVTMAMFGSHGPPTIAAVPFLEATTAEVRPALLLLLAAVALLLAAATGNVASLQLARAAARVRELAVRAALGAGRGRLARLLLAESLLLGVTGGAVGLVLAAAACRLLPSVLPPDFPRLHDVSVSPRVAGFAVALSLGAALVFGLLPALFAGRLSLTDALAEGSRATGGPGQSRVRRAILVGQVAVASALLAGAFQLGESFFALLSADRGFRTDHLLTASLPMPDPAFTPERRLAILEGLLDRLRGLPAIRQAAFTTVLPLGGNDAMLSFEMPRRDGAAVQAHSGIRAVSPGYFAALGRRIVAGRGLVDTDTATSQPVLVVNQTFARLYLGRHPVGTVVPAGLARGRPRWEVVGVVEDLRPEGPTRPPQPEILASYRQLGPGVRPPVPTLVARTAGPPAALVPALRRLVREQDATLAPGSILTMDQIVAAHFARPRLYSLLLAAFAACALAIAGVGLFGLLSYLVSLRTREIGVRLALGARPGQVAGLVAGQGLRLTAFGLGLGLAASLGLTRFLTGLAPAARPQAPAAFTAVAVVLVAVTGAACLLPARRAARIDPQRALRME